MNPDVSHLYSNDPRARMMTILELESFLQNAVYCGPILGPDTKLFEKEGRFYRVIIPCLACLGLTQYDKNSPIAEIVELDIYDM